MQHKFYYSACQAAMRPAHFTWVWNGKQWVAYSEWCSSGQDSNWEDAKLVFETNEQPQIKVESYEDPDEDYLFVSED